MEHCEKYAPLISAAVDGELSAAERSELMDHLAQCPACREVYSEMMAMHEAFSQLEAEVPGDLAGDVMAKVRTQRQVKRPRHYWWQITAAAACCALVFLGYQHFYGAGPMENTADTAGEAAPYAAVSEDAGADAASAPDLGEAATAAPAPAPAPGSLTVENHREGKAGAVPSDEEIMEDVLTYFQGGTAAVSTAAAEAEDQHGEVPCPTLSSDAPELETWLLEHVAAEGYSSGDSSAQAWLLTVPEYEELADYLDAQAVPYTLEGGDTLAEDGEALEETGEMVCVVYLPAAQDATA